MLILPTTGSYRFSISSDDQGSFLMGTDDTPETATERASVPGWSSPNDFSKYSEQTSAYTNLVAGQRYYLEALFKEGGGNDHLQVAWEGPGISQEVIPGQYLYVYVPNTAPDFASNPLVLPAGEEDQPYTGNLASHISDIDVLTPISSRK